ncbi:MAG: hypothetical protein KF729_01530 [Sandaracinaceae bacterium]|nr:hypothetical protein [Sandaracinaceae bacterium]
MHIRLARAAGLAVMVALAPALFGASRAEAQCAPSADCVTVGSDGKGILGLGIIGAEIGFMLPAILVHAGVRELDEWWAYVLFPLVFGAGGAVAGYFALEEPIQMSATGVATRGFPEVAVAMFAVGMALIVPTFVGVLALTAYNPGPSEGTGRGATGDEDSDADEGGASETPSPSNEAVRDEEASAIRRTLAGGPGLFRYDEGRLLLGIPMAYATDTFTAEERRHMRLSGSLDYVVPLASGVF